LNLQIFFHFALEQGRIQKGDLGIKTPCLKEIFFNLLGFFEKKIPKHPLIFAVHIKRTPPQNKNSGNDPCLATILNQRLNGSLVGSEFTFSIP